MHWTRLFVLLLLVSAPLQAGNVIARAYSSFIHDLAYSVTSTQRDMLGVELESKHVAYEDQPVTHRVSLAQRNAPQQSEINGAICFAIAPYEPIAI